jgi:copper resistance protein C
MRPPTYFRFLTGPSLICGFVLFLLPAAAWAHAYPESVWPPDGATVTEPPAEVRIKFTEGVELEFSRIEVKNAGGQRVSKGKVRRLSADTLAVELLSLGPGNYTIEWQVLSVDTHITDGVLRFTIQPSAK